MAPWGMMCDGSDMVKNNSLRLFVSAMVVSLLPKLNKYQET